MPRLGAVRLLCLAAALLLASPIPGSAQGWYLLTPPVVRSTRAVDEAAPLPKWRPSRLYENARECEEIRLNWVAGVQRFTGSLRQARAAGTRCIAAADPRLASGTPASAQIGWYLLVPPQQEETAPVLSESAASSAPSAQTDSRVALAHWGHRASFDTEVECEKARQQLPPSGARAAQCVSVTDRRLAPQISP